MGLNNGIYLSSRKSITSCTGFAGLKNSEIADIFDDWNGTKELKEMKGGRKMAGEGKELIDNFLVKVRMDFLKHFLIMGPSRCSPIDWSRKLCVAATGMVSTLRLVS